MSDLWTKYRNRNKWKWINRLPQQSDKQSNILQWVCFINNSWCCFTGWLQTDDQTSLWLAGTAAHSCKPISWKVPTTKHLSSLLLNAPLLGKTLSFHISSRHLSYNVAILSSVSNKTGAVVFNPLIRTEIATNRAIEADDLTGGLSDVLKCRFAQQRTLQAGDLAII